MTPTPSAGLLFRPPEYLERTDANDTLRSMIADSAESTDDCSPSDHSSLEERLDRIEGKVDLLLNRKLIKEWYSISEAAEILHKAEFTVREWCRLGRVNAEKRLGGRGRTQEWIIAHSEILRIQKEGLLPLHHSNSEFK